MVSPNRQNFTKRVYLQSSRKVGILDCQIYIMSFVYSIVEFRDPVQSLAPHYYALEYYLK